jgi:hypothetical protein
MTQALYAHLNNKKKKKKKWVKAMGLGWGSVVNCMFSIHKDPGLILSPK